MWFPVPCIAVGRHPVFCSTIAATSLIENNPNNNCPAVSYCAVAEARKDIQFKALAEGVVLSSCAKTGCLSGF